MPQFCIFIIALNAFQNNSDSKESCCAQHASAYCCLGNTNHFILTTDLFLWMPLLWGLVHERWAGFFIIIHLCQKLDLKTLNLVHFLHLRENSQSFMLSCHFVLFCELVDTHPKYTVRSYFSMMFSIFSNTQVFQFREKPLAKQATVTFPSLVCYNAFIFGIIFIIRRLLHLMLLLL